MALVEAADNLSIQVHPDDEMAKRLIGKTFGKNESFFIKLKQAYMALILY